MKFVARATLLAAIVLSGCGPPAVPTVPAVAVVASKPPPPPAPAKLAVLSFPISPFVQLRSVDLGGGDTLRIGASGRRGVRKGGAFEEGPPMPEPISAALRIGNEGFVLTSESGLSYVVKEPLGPVVEVRDGPSANVRPRRVATGKGAIFVVDAKGLHRSTDGARTWHDADLFPFSPGEVTDVAVARNGEGLVGKLPQQLYATKDDGTTWSPIDSLGIGFAQLKVESAVGGEQVWLHGERGTARLEGGAMAAADSPNKQKPFDASASWYEAHLAGPWLVVIEHGGSSSKTTIGPLGGKLAETKLPCGDPMFDGDDANVWLVCKSDRAVHRWSTSEGWRSVAALGGRNVEIDGGIVTIAGTTWVGHGCEEGVCGSRKISFDGKTFVDVKLGATSDVRAVTFDAKSHRGFVVADHSADGRLSIYASGPSSPVFAKTKMLDLDAREYGPVTATVDDEGVLRVGACRYEGDMCLLFAFRDGKLESKRRLEATHALALVGKRGMWLTAGGLAVETSDGGASWSLVPFPADREELECNVHGCLRHHTLRLGWGAPAIAGKTEAIPPYEGPEAVSTPSAAPVPTRKILCKPKGAPIPANPPRSLEIIEGASHLSWVEVVGGAVVAKVAAADKVTEIVLLPKKSAAVLAKESSDDRVIDGIAIRRSAKHNTLDMNVPPDIDVAWLPASKTSGPVRAHIPSVKWFDAKKEAFAASRVSGGVVVRVDKLVHFIDEKGVAKRIDLEPLDSFARTAKGPGSPSGGFVAARLQAERVLQLAWSGTPNAHATWHLTQYAQTPPSGRLFSTPEGVFVNAVWNDQQFFIRVPDARASDPKEISSASGRELLKQLPTSTCDEKWANTPTALTVASELAIGPRWQVIVENHLPSLSAVVTLRPRGKAGVCVSSVIAVALGRVHVLLASPEHSWLVTNDALRPLECTLPTEK